MSYMLRDRPDGQVEIVLMKPILIGIFPEREVGQRVCALLQDEEIDWPVEEPAGFGTAAADVAEAEAAALEEAGEARLRELVEKHRPAPTPAPPRPVRNLPAVVPDKPVAPAFLTPKAPLLTEAERDRAFARIAAGEKISTVALELGLSTGQLQGMWSQHKRRLQKHLAEGGQITCRSCKRQFTPSISHPETCARCSHD